MVGPRIHVRGQPGPWLLLRGKRWMGVFSCWIDERSATGSTALVPASRLTEAEPETANATVVVSPVSTSRLVVEWSMGFPELCESIHIRARPFKAM